VSVEFSSNWSQILRTLESEPTNPLCLNWSWVHSISGLVMSTTATANACVAPTPAAADPIPRPLPSSREPRATMPCPCRLPPVQGLSYSSTDAADHAHPHGCYHDGPSSVETIWFCPDPKRRIMWLVSWEEKRPKSWLKRMPNYQFLTRVWQMPILMNKIFRSNGVRGAGLV
jgi:hypothetical protein